MPTNVTIPAAPGTTTSSRPARKSPATTWSRPWHDVGVDGAILVSPFSMYQYDASPTPLEVYANSIPTRFGLVRPFDPDSDTIEQEMEEWTSHPRRSRRTHHACPDRNRGRQPRRQPHPYRRRQSEYVPINVMCSGKLPIFRRDGHATIRTPNSSSITSALAQPYDPPAPPDAWADLPSVLALAKLRQRRNQDLGRWHTLPRPLPLPGHLGTPKHRSSTHMASTVACGAPTGLVP